MNTTQLLESLTELYAQKDLLLIDRKRAEQTAIPAEVQKRLDDIAAECCDKEMTVNANIAKLESEIKQAVITTGATAKGGSLQAVYTAPRITWETKGLEGLMVAIPELEKFRKVGSPSVSIRKG